MLLIIEEEHEKVIRELFTSPISKQRTQPYIVNVFVVFSHKTSLFNSPQQSFQPHDYFPLIDELHLFHLNKKPSL